MEITSWGISYKFLDTPQAEAMVKEIFSDNYKVMENSSVINFQPGDVVIDLGANEGMFSIMLAKVFPLIKVIAVEPAGDTFQTLIENISLNKVENIATYNVAVGRVAGKKEMVVNTVLTGGSTFWETPRKGEFWEDHKMEMVKVVPLDRILARLGPVKLLKFDIEGSEYDVFFNSALLGKVEFTVGEIHINQKLMNLGRNIEDLVYYLGMQTKLLRYETCYMAE